MSANLLSVPQLTKNGLTVVYGQDTCSILTKPPDIDPSTIQLTAHKDPHSNLYIIPQEREIVSAFKMLQTHYSIANANTYEAIRFWHKCFAGAPANILYHAVSHFSDFKTFPNLTAEGMRKNWPFLDKTYLGHNREIPHSRHSTKPQSTIKITMKKLIKLCKVPAPDKTVYADAIGKKFPITSCRGYRYILNIFCAELDITHSELLKDDTGPELLKAYQRGIEWFRLKGYIVTDLMTDNKSSKEIDKYFSEPSTKIEYNKCPPHEHRANKSERDIQTWEAYFISALTLADYKFPIEAWCYTIPQVDLIVNLLRPSPTNPNKSAWSSFLGKDFDYNQTPFVPIGTKGLVYIPPQERPKLDIKAVQMFFTSIAPQHYRCWNMYNPVTNKEVVRHNVIFQPTHYTLPGGNSNDILEKAISTFTAAIQALSLPSDKNIQALKHSENLLQSARELGKIFNQSLPQYEEKYADFPRINTDLEAMETGPPANISSTMPTITRVPDNQPPPANQPPSPTLPIPTPPTSNTRHIQFNPTVAERTEYYNDDYEEVQQHDTTKALQMKASPTHIQLKKYNGKDCPPFKLPPPNINIDHLQTNPNPDHLCDSKQKLYESGFTTKASDSLTKRAHDVPKLSYTKESKGPNKSKVDKAMADEIDRLVSITQCTEFVDKIPKGAETTYPVHVLENKYDDKQALQFRIRTTINGKNLTYDKGNSSKVASNLTTNILLNLAASTGAHIIRTDISNFFLEHQLKEPRYLKYPWESIPEASRIKYKLKPNTDRNGNQFVYMQVNKAMYGLKESNAISAKDLQYRLSQDGYYYTGEHGLYIHADRKTIIDIHVDDFLPLVFGTHEQKYANAQHLVQCLEKTYKKVKANYNGLDQPTPPTYYKTDFCGLTIEHYLKERKIEISMPDYYQKLIKSIPAHIKPRNTPGKPYDIKYGQKEQFSKTLPTIQITKQQEADLQKFCGQVIWYSQIAPDVSAALSKLASQIKLPNSETIGQYEFFQGYFKRYGNHKITYHASNMILHAFSDASFDSDTKSRSRGGYVLCLANGQPNVINGPIAFKSHILPGVPRSTAEAEIEQHFDTGDIINQARNILEVIGYKQKPVIILSDNMCSIDYANDQTKGKRLKSLERRLQWLKYQVEQGAIIFQYVTSENNLADLFTKLFPKARHDFLTSFLVDRERMMLLQYTKELQGCVRLN